MNHADAIHLLKVSEESLHAMDPEEINRHFKKLRSKGHPDSPSFDGGSIITNHQEIKQAFTLIMEEKQNELKNPKYISTGLIDATLKWYELTMTMNHWMFGGWYSSMVNRVLNTEYK